MGDTSYLTNAARRFREAVVGHVPKGAVELGAEGHAWPRALAEIAFAMEERARVCAKNFPVEQEYTTGMARIAELLAEAGRASTALGPYFDAAHQRELERLMNPRPNEGMWDTSSNR